ncbi:hypothetical protein [Aquimarina rhabdastrellae]
METSTLTQKPKVTTQATTDTVHETPGISKRVIHELSQEINNMLSFAVYNGITINTDVITLIQNSSVEDLIQAHNLLCKNIAPATPKSIEYTKSLNQQNQKKSLFTKLPLIRNLIFLSIFFLITFILTGLSPEVNNNSLAKGILDNNGFSLLVNIGFLTSIAGLGVIFYLLKNVSKGVKNGTLIQEDTVYYVSLIVLGIIAGLIMSEIISFYKSNDVNGINLFNKGVLALIGGFSSDAIFSILESIINKIKGIFLGGSSN